MRDCQLGEARCLVGLGSQWIHVPIESINDSAFSYTSALVRILS